MNASLLPLLLALSSVTTIDSNDPAPQPANTASQPIAWLSIPGETWAFAFDLPGYPSAAPQVGFNPTTKKPSARLRTDRDDGVNVSAFIEGMTGSKSANEVRDGEWPKHRRKPYESVEYKDMNGVACAETVMTKPIPELAVKMRAAGLDPKVNSTWNCHT